MWPYLIVVLPVVEYWEGCGETSTHCDTPALRKYLETKMSAMSAARRAYSESCGACVRFGMTTESPDFPLIVGNCSRLNGSSGRSVPVLNQSSGCNLYGRQPTAGTQKPRVPPFGGIPGLGRVEFWPLHLSFGPVHDRVDSAYRGLLGVW